MTLIGHGTEICTSTTRPSAAVEGMMIYETDTDKVLVYSGSAWVEVTDITNGASNPIQRNVSSVGFSNAFSTTASSSYVDIPSLTCSITPTSTSSKIEINWSIMIGCSQTSIVFYQLVRNSTSIAVGSGCTSGNVVTSGRMDQFAGSWIDSPNTTSSITYKLQWYRSSALGGTLYLNRRGDALDIGTISFIYAREIPA